VTSEGLLSEVLADRAFYQASGGGVTLSGGEPLQQAAFALPFARRCRAAGLAVALDTCGQAEPAVFSEALREADLVLFDLKLADPARHLEFVGAPIEGILANFERAAASGLPLWIRTPVIPGSTDSEENLRAIARLIRKIAPGAARWDLLAFSNLCGAKYEMLGLRFPLQGIPLFTPDELERRLAWVLAEGAGMARLSGPTRRGGT
jgi:pyruvate formate lyase activating enzyme